MIFVGRLYELIGDCTRAEMHYKIGLDIARVINASNIVAKFLCQLFDLASRANKYLFP